MKITRREWNRLLARRRALPTSTESAAIIGAHSTGTNRQPPTETATLSWKVGTQYYKGQGVRKNAEPQQRVSQRIRPQNRGIRNSRQIAGITATTATKKSIPALPARKRSRPHLTRYPHSFRTRPPQSDPIQKIKLPDRRVRSMAAIFNIHRHRVHPAINMKILTVRPKLPAAPPKTATASAANGFEFSNPNPVPSAAVPEPIPESFVGV